MSNDRSYIFVFWQKRLFVADLSQGSSEIDLIKFRGESSVEENFFWNNQKNFWKNFFDNESILPKDALSISFIAKNKKILEQIEKDCHWKNDIIVDDIEKAMLHIVTDSNITLKFLLEKKSQKLALTKANCDKNEDFYVDGFSVNSLLNQLNDIQTKPISISKNNSEPINTTKSIGFDYFEAKMKENASKRIQFKSSSITISKK